jgi:hypothetical protein
MLDGLTQKTRPYQSNRTSVGINGQFRDGKGSIDNFAPYVRTERRAERK